MKQRRLKATIFFALAAAAGLMGASITSGYREGALQSYGELRPVAVAVKPLPPGRVITPESARQRIGTVRVPERFVPEGVVSVPEHLIGLKPRGRLPTGTYLGLALFSPPESGGSPDRRLGTGRQPVEITVAGTSALTAAGAVSRVDIIVTSEPMAGAAKPHAYVAATAVPLIDLSPSRREGEPASAVLGLTRKQALRLIRAESFSRAVRLVPSFDR